MYLIHEPKQQRIPKYLLAFERGIDPLDSHTDPVAAPRWTEALDKNSATINI
jgi:hypothetical protein